MSKRKKKNKPKREGLLKRLMNPVRYLHADEVFDKENRMRVYAVNPESEDLFVALGISKERRDQLLQITTSEMKKCNDVCTAMENIARDQVNNPNEFFAVSYVIGKLQSDARNHPLSALLNALKD